MNLATQHTQQLAAFIRDVQRRAGLDDYERSYDLTVTTLSTLSKALPARQARQLAQWLPLELAKRLVSQVPNAATVSPNAFVGRIGHKSGTVDTDCLTVQVRGVLQALRDTAPAGELGDTIAQLPAPIAALFEGATGTGKSRALGFAPTASEKVES